MITSLSWLKNHLSTNANLNQIADRLTDIGLEVESIQSSNSNLDLFIVCKIIKSQKHPNADKLKLCDVDIGFGNLIKVVCGAENARDGLFSVYAPPGAVVPKTNLKAYSFMSKCTTKRRSYGYFQNSSTFVRYYNLCINSLFCFSRYWSSLVFYN